LGPSARPGGRVRAKRGPKKRPQKRSFCTFGMGWRVTRQQEEFSISRLVAGQRTYLGLRYPKGLLSEMAFSEMAFKTQPL